MTTTINFNDLSRGTIVDNEYSADGVTISATGGSGKAMIFDTSNPTGGDDDLATNNLGNVLIISEDGDQHDPDDEAHGGKLIFDFDNPSDVQSLTVLDMEHGAWIKLYDEDGNLLKQVDAFTADNGQKVVHLNQDGVARMEVILGGSGAIDNLVFEPGATGDGVVDGEAFGEEMVLGYDDGNAPTDQGGDVITTGDDVIFGNGGNDTIDGNAGNDTIYGDDGTGGDTLRETFEWSEAPNFGDNNDASGFTQDTGNANVTFSFTSSHGVDNNYETDAQNIDDLDAGTNDNSSFESVLNGDANSGAYSWNSDTPLANVEFRVNDIDGDGRIVVRAYDAHNNPITVVLSDAGNGLSLSNTDGVAGADTATSVDNNYTQDSAAEHSVLVTIPGPVSRWEVLHEQDGGNNSGINITDIAFDVVFDAGQPGDDVISGGAGDDVIFGEEGDDTLAGDAGTNVLTGGSGDDVFIGGEGADQFQGNAGQDNVDYSASDAAVQVNLTDGTTEGGDAANDTILGGIDGVIGSEFDDTLIGFDQQGTDPADTFTNELFGEGGNDTIEGRGGADLLDGGDDRDVILGGAGDVVDGGAGGDDYDILDLTGQGPFVIEDQVVDGNGNGTNGTIVFVDTDGNPTGETLTFTEIEEIRGEVFNRDPDAVNDMAETDEDTPVTIPVLDNDSDPDGDPLTIISAVSPNGEVTINPDGTVTFTPDENFNGETTVDYVISDGNGGTDRAWVKVTVNPVNDAPDAVNDMAETDEDTPVTIPVLDNDSDPDGDPLTIISAVSPNGEVTINPDGTVTFTPDENFNGETTVDYVISDGNGGTDRAWVKVTVNPVNDGPIANDDTAEVPEDGEVTIPVLANDEDPDGDPLTVTEATSPDGDVTINPDGTITFSPNPDFNGPTTITYTVQDPDGEEDTGTVTVNVTPVNDGPIANDDTAEVPEDGEVTIPVLANDEDPDGDPLTVTEATSPDGTVDINPDGTITFTPDENFNGPTTITYTVQDPDGAESTATVTVNVTPVNDAPDAVNDAEETPEETPVTIDALANDTDPDGDPLTITGASVPSDVGTVEIVDNKLVFTPAENFNGPATISYSITDGNGGTDTAEVVVNVTPVNDDPVAVDDVAETDEDTPVVIDLIGNDTDVDGDPLTIGDVSVPADQGTVVDNGDGTVTFTPAPNFNGPATITYTVVDGQGGEDEGQAVVSVGAVNDGPEAIDDVAETDEDTPVTIDAVGNDVDPDGDPLTIVGASVPADQGSVEVVGNELVFTPAENFNGPATITYTITDGNGGTDTAEVAVTVNPVNDDPVAVDDIETTDEDTPVVIDLIGNDTDVDGDPLTIGEVSVPADEGTVVDNGDGTVTFTPAPNFNGPATITYTVVDGQGGEDEGEAIVSVGAVNDSPDAVDDSDTTPEDTPIVLDVLDNDSDPDGDDLTVISATVPADQGTVEINPDNTVTFTPAPNFTGEATVTYTISDGNGGTDTAEHDVTVTPVEDAPITVDDVAETDEDTPVTIPVLDNDSDPDGDPLTVVDATSPDGDVTINPDGTITFTPDPDFNGPTTITYTVSDPDGNETPGTVDVTVNPVNDGPIANDDTAEVPEDGEVTIPVLDNDSDPDGDPLTVTEATSPDGDVTINPDGTITFTPDPDFSGPTTITYTVQDPDGEEDTGTVTVNVTPVDDAPVAEDDVAETDEDTPVTIPVLDNDSDPDGDPLTVTEATSPDGTVDINPDGTITFTPDENFNGPTTITYTVQDPDGNEDTATVDVNVVPVNDAPDAVDDSDTTEEDTPITVNLLANDFDVDGDDLTVVEATVPADEGTLVDNGDGTVTFTPAPNFNGTATITYTIEDQEGLTDTAVHTIDVTPVDDAPITEDDVAETDEDTPVTIPVLDNDSDPDGDPLTVTEATSPDGDVTINPDGTITFTPDPDFNGPTTITYTVSDPDGNETPGTVDVTVNPVNDAPEAEDDSATTPFNTAVVIPVLDNDDDPDGDPLTVTEATSPDGDVTINPDGTLTFTPNPGFEGNATINYTIQDPDGLEDDAVVTVLVEDEPLDGIVQGTDGDDLIDVNYEDDPQGDKVDNNDEILPGEGPNDDIIQAGDGNDTIIAGEGDDDVYGGKGDDVIDTGEGNDIVDGGSGDDVIDTSAADPLDLGKIDQSYPGVIDGEGDPDDDPALALDDLDSVLGGAGNDTIRTGDDNDTVEGGSGNDDIDGGIDDDLLFGNSGDDQIVGGEGDDTIEGGSGNDTIYAGFGPNTPPGLQIFNIEDDGTNPLFGPDLVPDNGRDLVDGGAGNDVIFGADDDDTLRGGSGDDVIDGEIDDDLIEGNTGDDTLIGGQGNDTLDGGQGDDLLDGGIGDDSLFGANDRDTFINVNGGDTVDGGANGDDFDTLDLRGSAPENGSLQVTFTGPDSNGNGFDGFVTYFDENGDETGERLTFTEIEDVIPCFTPGTMIATPTGERKVEDLQVGDRVITRDNGIQTIRWVGQRVMTGDEFTVAPHLKPVLIRQGALGMGLPERDMMVSPNHRVLVANDKAELFFEEREVLVAAKHLTGMDGVDLVEVSETTFIHVMFDQHEVILSDGAWTESFQPGDMTLGSMGDAQRAEIFELFPELETREGIEAYTAARRSLKKHEAKLLMQ